MRCTVWSRALALAVISLVMAFVCKPAPASADTAVERALEQRRAAVDRVHELQRLLKTNGAALSDTIHWTKLIVRHADLHEPSRGYVRPGEAATRLREAQRRLSGLSRWVGERIDRLKARWRVHDAWLDTAGIFRVCPVPEWVTISDDFGAMRRLPKIPPHVHMGNDVLAPTGSPILAPFDGYATSGWNVLGGNIVHVEGEHGSVYNAHLISFGTLGPVETGDVVGYIGATGDATAPHDHIEWHPGGGPAVDPHEYLLAACVDV